MAIGAQTCPQWSLPALKVGVVVSDTYVSVNSEFTAALQIN